MIKDFILNSIVEEVINEIALHDEFNDFNELDYEKKVELIYDIINIQSLAIVDSIKNKEFIKLPLLGVFKIRDGRKYVINKKDEIARKFNLSDYNSASDEMKKLINQEVKVSVRAYKVAKRKDFRATHSDNKLAPIRSRNILDNIKKALDKSKD